MMKHQMPSEIIPMFNGYSYDANQHVIRHEAGNAIVGCIMHPDGKHFGASLLEDNAARFREKSEKALPSPHPVPAQLLAKDEVSHGTSPKVDMEAVKGFVDAYISQDNCGTAWPYSYVVQEKKRIPAFDGCGDFTTYNYPKWDLFDYKSKAELIETAKDYGEDFDEDNITECEWHEEWIDVQWFFTKEEAEGHLARNGHNLTSPRLYVKHFYRNTEALLIMRTLFALVGKDFDEEAKMLKGKSHA